MEIRLNFREVFTGALRGVKLFFIWGIGWSLMAVLMTILSNETRIQFDLPGLHNQRAVYVVGLTSFLISAGIIYTLKESERAMSVVSPILDKIWEVTTLLAKEDASIPQSAEYERKRRVFKEVASEIYPSLLPVLVLIPSAVYLYTGEFNLRQISIGYIGAGVAIGGGTNLAQINWTTLDPSRQTRREMVRVLGLHAEVGFLLFAAAIQMVATMSLSNQVLIGNIIALIGVLVVFLLGLWSVSSE